jgi:hypothetical protein
MTNAHTNSLNPHPSLAEWYYLCLAQKLMSLHLRDHVPLKSQIQVLFFGFGLAFFTSFSFFHSLFLTLSLSLFLALTQSFILSLSLSLSLSSLMLFLSH